MYALFVSHNFAFLMIYILINKLTTYFNYFILCLSTITQLSQLAKVVFNGKYEHKYLDFNIVSNRLLTVISPLFLSYHF